MWVEKRSSKFRVNQLKTPVSITSPERLVLTLNQQLLKHKNLEDILAKMELEIETQGKKLMKHQKMIQFHDILKKIKQLFTSFYEFFWDELQKYLSTSKTRQRYHPMIIKYCLNLAAKSTAAY